MPIAALATSGLFVMGRRASDAKAKKEELREAQRGMPPVPETDTAPRTIVLRTQDADLEKEGRGSHDGYTPTPITAGSEQSYSKSSKTADTPTPTEEGLPPPYSREIVSSPTSIFQYSPNLDRTSSTSSRPTSLSTTSNSTLSDAHAVRVRTKGHDLKSGFPYHPSLFDLRVRPDDWQRFSDQVTESTKFDRCDYAKMWAAAGSMALTGSVLTTAWVGRTINRSIQEKKVSTGLVDLSEGGLGHTLQQWNDSYFAPLGLCATLELSDSTMRKPKQKSSVVRKPSLMYNTREERERKREDRKFVMVVAGLEGIGTGAQETGVCELAGESDRAELPVPEDSRGFTAELPGDTGLKPAELPPAEDVAKEDLADVVCGVAELPADIPVEVSAGEISTSEKKVILEDRVEFDEVTLLPRPLVVRMPEKT